MVPVRGRLSPEIALSVVLLPAPLAPIKPTSSPGLDLQRRVLEQGASAEGFGGLGNSEHMSERANLRVIDLRHKVRRAGDGCHAEAKAIA